MELYKFNHESIVGTCNTSFLFDKLFSFFIVVSQFKNNISYYDGNWPGDTLDAVYEYLCFVFLTVLYEVNGSVEKTLDIFVLRVFEEKRQVWNILMLKGVLTLISCTVYYCLYFMFLEYLFTFSHLFSSQKNTFNYLITLYFKLLHLKLVTGSSSDIELDISTFLFLLYCSILDFLKGFKTKFQKWWFSCLFANNEGRVTFRSIVKERVAFFLWF